MIVPADGTREWWPEKTPDPLNLHNGTVTVNADDSFVYIPALDYSGSDTFVVQVSDANGGTALETVTLGS
jgi:hypothetical protein